MKTVHKFKLDTGLFLQPLPKNAKIVFFGPQGDDLFMWVYLNPEDECVNRYFRVIETGHDIDQDTAVHLHSTFMDAFVFHLFEIL